ncbi:MAG: hypothetical protein D6768_11335 [Chloroflexi bacterium]|nr:MAG: hypothetical protein D6768_11335 [Chloroflexota bacterium]
MTTVISPFATPDPNLPIVEGTPAITRPTKEEIAAFPAEAKALVDSNWTEQKLLLESGRFNLDWLEGRHVLLAGATGPGLGGALATAVLGHGKAASVILLGRDLKKSLNFETGKVMQDWAQAAGMGERFHWLNGGMALEGKALEDIINALKIVGAGQVVYFNTVAAALSGMLPGMPPVYVKDVDANGNLFQWKLLPLNERQIEITKFVMGEMAVTFPEVLAANGFQVSAAVYADWRGSLDKAGRDPSLPEYGRQGAYSTSLYLPKEILQAATRQAYGSGGRPVVMDIFYPMMRTRALPLIPGGMTMANVNETLMKKEGIRMIGVPELALGALDRVGKALTQGYDNPFPRLDSHDAHLDEWFYEIVKRLNNNEDSDFYYKRWM